MKITASGPITSWETDVEIMETVTDFIWRGSKTSAVILELPKIKSVTISIVSPSIFHKEMGPDAMILVFGMLSFKPAFSLSYFILIKRLFDSSLLFAIWVVSSAYLRLLIFLQKS